MKASTHALLSLAALGLSSIAANAAVVVTPSHIVSGSATGTLIAIDVPFVPNGTTGGPDWTEDADDGFTTVNDGIQDYRVNDKLWEPDGTPAAEAGSYFSYPNGPEPGVKWVFSQVASGIDIPDGATINAIYAVWFGRGSDGITYRYAEGAASDSYVDNQGSASTGDLVLSWTDAVSTVRNANFQRIFTGPIVVEGGDGFELWGTDNIRNAAHIDAVVIDVTLPSIGTPPTISSLSPDGTSPVPVTTGPVATFSEPIALTGNGTVTLRNLTLGSDSDVVISLPDAQVSASGTDVTINPTANLALNTDYAIQISADAVEDLGSESFAGILDDTTWTFSTTADGTAPTITSTVPADGAADVAPFSDLVATFDEDVVLTGTGSVTLRNRTLGSGSDVVISLPDAQVSVSGADLTIIPSVDLDAITDYAVQISADAVEDNNGNPFAGIGDDTTWNFTTATPPSGGLEVTPDHIVSGPVTGTLLAVDVPFNNSTGSVPVFGGPDWPEDADDGFTAPTAANDGLRGSDGMSNWEPDGTALGEAKGYFTFGNGPAPSVTWTFDVADGTVINAVYATWNSRGSDGITYQFSEGAASDSIIRQTGAAAPAADLQLKWTDDASAEHTGNFERIFTGPITVEGGDGFTLSGTDNVGNAAHVDAIVLDVSGKAVITSFGGAGATGVINQPAKTIALEVPFGTDLATLAPTFTLSSGTCDQTSGSPPSTSFADQNPATYIVTDTSTDPDTVNTYTVTVTVGPQVGTLVIDLGTSPSGRFIEGGTFIGSGPANLPLPSLPAGSILRSIAVDTVLESTDNGADGNWASDLALLLDPTPGTPGGDFSVEITNGTDAFGGTLKLSWPSTADAGASTPLVDTKTDADLGTIDLATTGLFLGNAFMPGDFVAGQGGTWSGTITLIYDIPSGGTDYATWAAGFLPDDVSNANGDFDGDGLTNEQERAFGLDPTSGSSVDPFTVPINAAGTFSYTRRDPALGGLTYTIWTSPDLENWTKDTGASQVPGTVVDEVQPVAVTLTAAAVDGKLFVEVRAN